MQLACPHCGRTLEYSGERPRFCSYCGKSLSATPIDETLSAPTLDMAAPVLRDAPQQLGPYRILRELGRGGMGAVFEAERQDNGRRVALKLLPENVYRTQASVDRFLREGQNAAAISHPRSTFVYAAGELDGQFFISMELMPGGTLRDWIDQRGAMPLADAVDGLCDVMDGLSAAHELGVIHRDIKPSNCFVDELGRVKVGDYGLSKSLVADSSLTRTGAFLGTPQFAAPEQIRGGDVDERTDIYSLGATLFFLLAGRAPFEGDAAQVIAAIASDDPPSIAEFRPDTPGPIQVLITRMLAKEPADRPQSLAEVEEALAPYTSQGVSIADLGRRLGAFFLDVILASFACGALATLIFAAVVVAYGVGALQDEDNAVYSIAFGAASTLALVAYFAIGDGIWGCTFGKRLLGLRVVATSGFRLGVARATVRAAIVPGLTFLCVNVVTALAAAAQAERSGDDVLSSVRMIVSQQVIPLVGWAIALLCLSPARRRNGYRGLHEIVSGSRVVRQHSGHEHRLLPLVVAAEQRDAEGDAPIANYQVLGLVARIRGGEVLLARDQSLDRPVWLVVRDDANPLTEQRMAVTRPSRLHWIDGGEFEESRWDAYEAVQGAPLAELAGAPPTMTWSHAARWLIELAEEISAGLRDDSLPPTIAASQLWVDRNGRVKLLDWPLLPEEPEAPSDLAEQAYKLIASILSRFRGAYPAGALVDLQAEYEQREPNVETFDWLADKLRWLASSPSRLRWDDRLGILAIGFSAETAVYYTMAVVLGIALIVSPLPLPAVALLLMIMGALTPWALGWLFHGGPVLAFAGVQLRRICDGSSAGRLASAWRTFWAWAPASVGYGLLAVGSSGVTLRPLDEATPEEQVSTAVFYFVLALMGLCGVFVQAAGALFALVNPQRAAQDVLAGVYLSPPAPVAEEES